MYDNTTDISIGFNIKSLVKSIAENNELIKEFINNHKEEIIEQAFFDARTINELNLNTFSNKEDN